MTEFILQKQFVQTDVKTAIVNHNQQLALMNAHKHNNPSVLLIAQHDMPVEMETLIPV
jgi:hypothetical protein